MGVTEDKQIIFSLVKRYYETHHATKRRSRINYAGRVYDSEEMVNLVSASLDFWLTEGEWTRMFEREFARIVESDTALFVNSGSSANLLALSALMSTNLQGHLRKGDEVLTVAAGFPTTVNPIIQNGLVPVFCDIDITSLNVNIPSLKKMYSRKVKAVMLAHTLGNPFNIREVTDFCEKHGLFLIADCCDSLGSTYDGEPVGKYGDISTYSFYPAHHITTGEGGMVCTDNQQIAKILRSMRDWGRACTCPSGKNNACGSRYSGMHGDLPAGYDHKYVYSEIGYNLKATDLQAAIGVAQLKKLPEFIRQRKHNYADWKKAFMSDGLFDRFHLPANDDGISWFGCPVTIFDKHIDRTELVKFLDDNGVETRLLFGGNLLRQPAYKGIKCRKDRLHDTDFVMANTFFLGTYPGIGSNEIKKVTTLIKEFVGRTA